MEGFTHITTFVEDARNLMLSQFQDEGNLKDLQEIMVRPFQEIEDAIHVLLIATYLDNAVGQLLEWFGDWVGQKRPKTGTAATDDNAYRVLIYGKIAENISQGMVDDLYNILRALKATNPRIYRLPGYALVINFTNNSLTLSCGCIRYILERASGPISIDIVEHTNTPFGFLGNTKVFGFDVGQIGESN